MSLIQLLSSKEFRDKQATEQAKDIKLLLKSNEPAADQEYLEVVHAYTLEDRLKHIADVGGEPGVETGYECINELYSIKQGLCTDWGGYPTMGKSTLLNQILINLSKFYGHVHMMFVPDAGSPEEVYSDLMWTYTGKTFDKRYPNRITPEEIEMAMPFISKHFLVIDKPSLRASEYEEVLRSCHKFKLKGIEFHSVVVDSWKDLKKTYQKSEISTDYLARMLSRRNAMSKFLNVHSHTIIHPSKLEKDDRGKAPGSYDYMGGSEWFNNAKSQVTCHRDKSNVSYTNSMTNIMEFHSLKQKPKIIGKEGVTTALRFDIPQNQYFELGRDGQLYPPRTTQQIKQANIEAVFDKNDYGKMWNESIRKDDAPF